MRTKCWALGAGLWLAAAVAAGSAAPARGASLVAPPAGVEDFSAPGLLSVDPDFEGFAPIGLTVQVEAGDLPGPLAFNSAIDNLTGELWGAFEIALEGATFASVGSVDAIFGGIGQVLTDDLTRVRVVFEPPESFGLDMGEVAGLGTDWQIDVSGLAAGETFLLTFEPFAVPEPASAALLLGGLLALARRGCARR